MLADQVPLIGRSIGHTIAIDCINVEMIFLIITSYIRNKIEDCYFICLFVISSTTTNHFELSMKANIGLFYIK